METELCMVSTMNHGPVHLFASSRYTNVYGLLTSRCTPVYVYAVGAVKEIQYSIRYSYETLAHKTLSSSGKGSIRGTRGC